MPARPTRTPISARWTARELVFGIGPAGTGKTYLAVAHAAHAARARRWSSASSCRGPAVEAGERLGFLPGDMKEKVDPYLRPLYDALYDMMPADKVERGHRRRRHRGRAARLHARPHAGACRRHPRRGAEHHADADEDVPDPPRREFAHDRHRRPDADRPAVAAPSRAWSRRCASSTAWPARSTVRFNDADVVRHPLVAEIVRAYDRDAKMARGLGVTRELTRPAKP